jgi:small conductance mechanosensitive channel
VIDAGPATGTVETISLRTTRLRDVNGTVWHLPNGQIERVGNRSQQWARAVLDVDVSYETEIAHATEVITAAAQTMCEDPAFGESILSAPEVWGVENLGQDSVTIRLVLKTAPHDQLRVTRELRARIKTAFDAAGIEIPFTQRTVWHRTVDGAVAGVPASHVGH